MRYIKYIILIWSILQSSLAHAQQYPVDVQAFVTPPYPQQLRSYWDTFESKIQTHLLLKDLNSPVRNVTLRFSLENLQGQVITQSAPYATVFQTQLTAGVRKTLSNLDFKAVFALENLSGISENFYNDLLPEGTYFFCFTAYDATTQTPISNKARAMVQIRRYSPPLLHLPTQGEIISKNSHFQHIVFQWTMRDPAPFTQYEFTLKEVWDNSLAPDEAFLSGRLIYQGNVASNTLLYGNDKPFLLENKRYAWRVRAFTNNLNNPNQTASLFKNNGESETFVFDYIANCEAPKFLIASPQANTANIRWQSGGSPQTINTNGSLYKVLYREKGKAWKSVSASMPNATLSGLKRGKNYIYKVGIACGLDNPLNNSAFNEQTYLYSTEQEFTTTDRISDSLSVQCGVKPQIRIKNREPLQEVLGVNETFTAGDFPITVLSATGSNGIFSGVGYVQVPYLADTKIKVTFEGITLNTERQLIAGKLVTTYDKTEKNVQFVQEGVGELFGDAGAKQQKINFEIAEIKKDENGRLIVVGKVDEKTGIAPQLTLPAGSDYQITDNSNKVWAVDEKGEVTSIEEKANTQLANNSIKENQTKNQEQPKTDHFEIQWDFSQSEFAFDASSKIPYKALVKGKEDTFQVSIHQKDSLSYSFHFHTDKGVKIASQELQKGVYKLSRKGLFDFADEELWVVAKNTKTDQEEIISKCILVHLPEKQVNVMLVPLKENLDLQTKITEIQQFYTKVGVNLAISVDTTFPITESISTENQFGDLSTYSPDQQHIISAYTAQRSPKSDVYYIFVGEQTSSQQGYMRLGGQFGFVMDNNARTIAHELGHGIFKLEHPFKKDKNQIGKTTSIMDYGSGTDFLFPEWKQIGDPKLKIYAFQGQEEGEYIIQNLDYICFHSELPMPYILKDLDNQNIILGKDYEPYAFVGSKTEKFKGRLAIIKHTPTGKLYFPLQSKYGENRQGYMTFDTDGKQNILFKDFSFSEKKGTLIYASEKCRYFINDNFFKQIENCRECNGLPQRSEQNHKFFIDEKLLKLPDYYSVEASNENEIKEGMRLIINADRRGQRSDKQDLSYSYSTLPSNKKAEEIYKTVVTLWNNYENFTYMLYLGQNSNLSIEKTKLNNKKLLMRELIKDSTLNNVSESFIKHFFKNKIKGYMNMPIGITSTYLWNENQRAKYEKAGEDLVNHFYKNTGENYYATKTIAEAIYETEDGKKRIDNMIKLINHILSYEIINDEVMQKNPLDDDWFTNRININCFPGFESKYLYNKIFSGELENGEEIGNKERLALFCIGGTQGAKVGVKDWKKIKENDKIGYEATVVLEYFDTFGVSENDYTKDLEIDINFVEYNYRGGVLAQWILQHQYGYQPFKDHLTYIIKIRHLWD